MGNNGIKTIYYGSNLKCDNLEGWVITALKPFTMGLDLSVCRFLGEALFLYFMRFWY